MDDRNEPKNSVKKRIMSMDAVQVMGWMDDVGESPIPNTLPLYLNDPHGDMIPENMCEAVWDFVEGIAQYSLDFFGQKRPQKQFISLLCKGLIPVQASFVVICSMLLEICPSKSMEVALLCRMFGDRVMDGVSDVCAGMSVSVKHSYPTCCVDMLETLLGCYARTDPYKACTCSRNQALFIADQTKILRDSRDGDGDLAGRMELSLIKHFANSGSRSLAVSLLFSGLESETWMLERTEGSSVAKKTVALHFRMLKFLGELAELEGGRVACASLSDKTHITTVATKLVMSPSVKYLSPHGTDIFGDLLSGFSNLLLVHYANPPGEAGTRGQECGELSRTCPLSGLQRCSSILAADQVPAALPRCFRSSMEKLIFRPCFIRVQLDGFGTRLPSFACTPTIRAVGKGLGRTFPDIKLSRPIILPLYILRLFVQEDIVLSLIDQFFRETDSN
jgi:hypothetical protein